MSASNPIPMGTGDVAYQQNRVRVADFGVLPLTSDLLVSIPSVAGKDCKVHVAIAGDLLAMMAEFKASTGHDLLVTCGIRAHRWKDRADYEAYLVANYTKNPGHPDRTREEAIAEGHLWIGFDSPHETGLAVDFGSCGLEPERKTAAAQFKTEAFAWLKANAYRFGFHPYFPEPWHWEHAITLAAWRAV